MNTDTILVQVLEFADYLDARTAEQWLASWAGDDDACDTIMAALANGSASIDRRSGLVSWVREDKARARGYTWQD